MGIITGTVSTRRDRVMIYGQEAQKFAEKIRFISKMKNDRLDKPKSETAYNVPLSKQDMKIISRLKYKEATINVAIRNAKWRGYMTRRSAHEIEKNSDSAVRDLIKEKLAFHHSKVATIEKTDGISICVEVPSSHQFLQNGFSGWNCQGSEAPACLIVCHPSHYHMLSRRLIYTAITRGKELVCLVGTTRGIGRACSNVDDGQRYTTLRELLS